MRRKFEIYVNLKHRRVVLRIDIGIVKARFFSYTKAGILI